MAERLSARLQWWLGTFCGSRAATLYVYALARWHPREFHTSGIFQWFV